jgi:hypothetical protein
MNLLERSIEIIEANQSKHGSYIASPNFSQYGYCWFRDGSFVAHAMEKAGRKESSTRFIRWGLNVLKRYRDSLQKATAGNVTLDNFLPTRYTMEGFYSEDNWTNAQSDGYGTFLWVAAQRPELLDQSDCEICDMTARYLERVWKVPCIRCLGRISQHGTYLYTTLHSRWIEGDRRYYKQKDRLERHHGFYTEGID